MPVAGDGEGVGGVAAVQGLKMVGVGIGIGLHLLSEVGGVPRLMSYLASQVVARSDGVDVGVGALKDTGHFQG